MGRVTWWILPVACFVLVQVVTLEGPAAAPSTAKDAAPAAPPAAPAGEVRGLGPVVLRDASGSARHAAVLPGAALEVHLPASARGHRVELVLELWAGDGTRTPWLTGSPRVPQDGVLRFAGLPAGDYAIGVQWGSGDGLERRHADRFAVPGTADLSR